MDKFKSGGEEIGVRHHANYVPRLSLEERDRRWQLLRERMVVEGIDCLLFVGNDMGRGTGRANMRYVTHIATGSFAVFPLVGEAVVWVSHTHLHMPASSYCFSQDWVKDIRPNEGPVPVAGFLKEHKYDRSTIGLVGLKNGSALSYDIIPALVADYFYKELPDANIVLATGLVNYLRLIKSPEEITMLEKAGEIAKKTIDTIIESAEPGKKECELYADMVYTQIKNGAEGQNFQILLSSGPVAGPGNNKMLLHGGEHAPTTRKLHVGDLIIVEFHANYGGYLAAAEFSLYLGKAPDELKRIHEVCVQCSEKLRETMKPGASFQEVLAAEREPCQRAGMDYIELGFHEHGLISAGPLSVVHKPAQGRLAGGKIAGLKVRENMVFGTNIDIHDPKWKKDVGLMLGDLLHITKDGARCLVNTPLDILEKSI